MRRILGFVAGALLAGAATFAVAQNTLTSSPAATGTATTSAAPTAQIVGTNPGRKQLRICNTGTTVIWIWPGALSPTVSAIELPALSSGTTGCFTEPDGTTGPGGAGHGSSWNMESVSGGGSASVFEWF
jgi:hypothetical protein